MKPRPKRANKSNLNANDKAKLWGFYEAGLRSKEIIERWYELGMGDDVRNLEPIARSRLDKIFKEYREDEVIRMTALLREEIKGNPMTKLGWRTKPNSPWHLTQIQRDEVTETNEEQWNMNRRTSVMTARHLTKDVEDVNDLLWASDQIFAWLQKNGSEGGCNCGTYGADWDEPYWRDVEDVPKVETIEELMEEARKRYGDLDFRTIWAVEESTSEVTHFAEAWKAVVSHVKAS